MAPQQKTLKIEKAHIIHRNFAGIVDPVYNRNGDRTFSLLLDPALADELEADGWNIKRKPSSDPQGPMLIYTAIKVAFGQYPPRIHMVVGDNMQTLGPDEVKILDNANIIDCDLVINPYHWTNREGSGVKGYLRVGYFNVEEEPFAAKYSGMNRGPRV